MGYGKTNTGSGTYGGGSVRTMKKRAGGVGSPSKANYKGYGHLAGKGDAKAIGAIKDSKGTKYSGAI